MRVVPKLHDRQTYRLVSVDELRHAMTPDWWKPPVGIDVPDDLMEAVEKADAALFAAEEAAFAYYREHDPRRGTPDEPVYA